MGKGDQRSRRGKIWRGTFGKRRPKKSHSEHKHRPPRRNLRRKARSKLKVASKAFELDSS